MAVSAGFGDFVREQMAGFGPVTLRRMFGGAGLFREGLMFALISDDVLYFKAGGEGRKAFEAGGLPPFTYATKTGEHTLTSYWRAPERVFDDPDEMAEWARRAFAVAVAAARGKKKQVRR